MHASRSCRAAACCRRTTRAPSADRSSATGSGSSTPTGIENAQTRQQSSPSSAGRTDRHEEQALRAEADGHADRQPHSQRQLHSNNPTEQTNNPPASTQRMSMTAATLVDRRDAEQALGDELQRRDEQQACSPTFQWSRKDFGFRNAGGTSTALLDSPFITRGVARRRLTEQPHFNAPYFDANDPEDRNNRQFAGSVSYFLTSRGTGRHDLKVGLRALHVVPQRRQLAVVNRLRVPHRLPDRRGGQAARRQRRRADPALGWQCGGPARYAPGTNWIPTPRRDARHQDAVALRCRTAGRPATGSRSTSAFATRRSGPRPRATSSAPTPTRIVPRLGVSFDVDGQRPDDRAGDLRPLLGPVHRACVRAQHQRRHAEPGDLRVHRPERSGLRLRPGHSISPTTCRSQRQLPDGQRVLR